MTSYGSVPLDGTKQVAYEVKGKGPLLTSVILGDDNSLLANGEVRDKELKRWEKVMAEGASRAPPGESIGPRCPPRWASPSPGRAR